MSACDGRGTGGINYDRRNPGLLLANGGLYVQKFAEARQIFASWESRNQEDPFGAVAMAASYLFEELYLQGVLTSDFFLNEETVELPARRVGLLDQ